MVQTIFGIDSVTLDPPATSLAEALARTKDNPIAIAYRKAQSAQITRVFTENFKKKSLFYKTVTA